MTAPSDPNAPHGASGSNPGASGPSAPGAAGKPGAPGSGAPGFTAPAGDLDAPGDTNHGEPGALGYVVVWLVLVVLATITLFASRAVTGDWGLLVAFVIASAKAALVVAFFMHLASGRPIYRITFTVAMAFLVLLVIGVLADVGTRSIASAYVDDLGEPLP